MPGFRTLASASHARVAKLASTAARRRPSRQPRPMVAGTQDFTPQQEPRPDRKHVVTAFVQRPSDGAVLLVLRSDKVGTYQHKWGAISGGVEGGDESPAARAQQEILEEAGLQPGLMRLVRGGRPLLVDDGRLSFAVHPFLFRLLPEHAAAAATLNWENDEARWVQPAAMRKLPTVPLLPDTYERVHLPPRQAAAVQRLALDRASGAAQLAAQAAAALAAEARALDADAAAGEGRAAPEGGGGDAMCTLRNFGYHLACCRPAMSAVANAVAGVLAAAHAELRARAGAFEATPPEACAAVAAASERQQGQMGAAAAALRGHARALLRDGMCLMTISLSSSVAAAVKEAAEGGMRLRAVVCESRPLCEGVQLAEAWAAAGVDVSLITDAQAALFVGQADLVLVGADALTADAAVNKAGTHLLAMAAQAAGVPVVCLADSGKVSPGPLAALACPGGCGSEAAAEDKGGEEVVAAWGRPAPEGVAVRNLYFEPTPLRLLSGVVTEAGRLDPASLAELVEQRRQQYRDAFQLP